jgi:hypothetical protein
MRAIEIAACALVAAGVSLLLWARVDARLCALEAAAAARTGVSMDGRGA